MKITKSRDKSVITKLSEYEFPHLEDGRSVSDLVDQVQVAFDAEAKSLATATRQGRPQQEVKDEWARKGEVSRRIGTEVHEYIANVLRGHHPDPIEALSTKTGHMRQFDRFWHKATRHFEPVWAEHSVTCVDYGLVGRVDALVLNAQTDELHLIDWKTGSYNSQGWNRLKEPFSDMWDNSPDLGALQIAIYRLMIERQVGVALGDGYLVHVSESAFHVRRMDDIRERVDQWLLQEARRNGVD